MEKVSLRHRAHVGHSRDRRVYPTPNLTEHLVSPLALSPELENPEENLPSPVARTMRSPRKQPATPAKALREGRLEAHSAKSRTPLPNPRCFPLLRPLVAERSLLSTICHQPVENPGAPFSPGERRLMTTNRPFISARSRVTTLSRRSRAQCPTCSFYVSWNHKQGCM